MDAAASKTLLQRIVTMKITKTQLKQIIEEEIEQIDELGKQLELDENFLDDAWPGTLKKVGKMTGKDLSRSQKQRARNKAAAAAVDTMLDPQELTPQEKEEYRRRREAEEQAKIDQQKKANRDWRDDYDFTKKDKKPQKTRRGERVHDREDADPDLSGYSESIDRNKLARIIAEELQKVLKSR
jgi:hypothetical protein